MKLIFYFFCLIFTTNIYSQATAPIEIDRTQMNLSLIDNIEGTGLFAGIDFGVENNVTLGVAIGLVSKLGFENYLFSSRIRMDYHFNSLLNLSRKWDVYLGGVSSIQFQTEGLNQHIYFLIDVGGRWYFSEQVGLNFEYGIDPVNYHSDYLQFGVSYRF